MANQVLIQFKAAGLEKAKALAKDIAAKVKEAARAIKDVEVRKKFRAAQKRIAGERADEIAEQERSLGLLKRGAALSGREVAPVGVRRAVNQGKEALEKVRSTLGAAATGNIAGALTLLGSVPVVGQVAAGVGAVAAIVLPILQRELDAKVAGIENRIIARQSEVFFEADRRRRLREDVEFRDRETRKAYREFQQTEAALKAGGWRRRGAFLE